MSRSEYVYLTNVTFVQMKMNSIEVLIEEKRTYIPLSQMSLEDVEKFNNDVENGSTGHTIAVRQWWADKAEVEYEENP